jgi:hypothetical protein
MTGSLLEVGDYPVQPSGRVNWHVVGELMSRAWGGMQINRSQLPYGIMTAFGPSECLSFSSQTLSCHFQPSSCSYRCGAVVAVCYSQWMDGFWDSLSMLEHQGHGLDCVEIQNKDVGLW